jgi:hypothetical protein
LKVGGHPRAINAARIQSGLALTNAFRDNARTVLRALTIVVLLTLTAAAAPRLKDRPAEPTAEDKRIAALKSKYDGIRRDGSPTEKEKLANSTWLVQTVLELIEDVKESGNLAGLATCETQLRPMLAADPVCRDLYDILMYDRARQKADAKK